MDHRAALLDAAMNLFAEHGYDAVGVQAIVEAVGVTKPTLYHYFGSKLGLFNTLVAEKGEALLADVREACVYDGDATGAITRVVRMYFEYAAAQPVFYRMMLSMWFAPRSSEYFPPVRALLSEQLKLIEAMFERAGEQHGNMRGRHRQYAVSLKGLVDTYIGIWLQSDLDLQSSDIQYRIVHQFMHGIFS